MPATGTGPRAPRRAAGRSAAVLAAVLLAIFALTAHHGMVHWAASAAPAGTAAAAEAPGSGHGETHPGSDRSDSGHSPSDQADCGQAAGKCQSAKVAVDVALPPRPRLVLPYAAPAPPTASRTARTAAPSPPDLAELSILRI
ncbi:DUF6153 family protein [Nocardiopsis potens]|uniref:DUF6153 family protein n=1 Tax=Nocardiopsis potens TaxID=1246458 RepID=UPI0003472F68|nr:DUF6153 family protein [Nocardiopsis potens]